MEYYSYHAELESVRRKLTKLEQENKNLRFELYQLNDLYKEAVNKIPLPIVLIDKSGKIQFNNDAFISLLDFNGREVAAQKVELQGVDIESIVTAELYSHLESFINRRIDFTEKKISVNDMNYHLSVHSVRKGEFAIVIFRLIASGDEKREELVYRLEEVIESNLSMIQRIGSLMGEEVAKSTEVLGSVIKMVK